MWNGSHCDLLWQTLFYRVTFLSCKLLNCDILRLDCKEYGLFNKTRNNSVFGGSVIAKFSSITASDCERKCLLNNKCKSINVEKGDKACELVSKTALDVKGSKTALVSKSDWIYKTIDQDVTLVCFDFRSFQAFLVMHLVFTTKRMSLMYLTTLRSGIGIIGWHFQRRGPRGKPNSHSFINDSCLYFC